MGHVSYWEPLDRSGGVYLSVEFQTSGASVVNYSLALVVREGEIAETIRVYDGAHGFNELHRFTRRDGKQQGVPFHPGTLGEGMRAAIGSVKSGFRQMIEGWEQG
ncbi:MAG: hypothetical protein ACTHNY_04690 [Solirubrobacterales bacterium]